jgi:Flp pilus assembly protein TadD
VHPEDNAAAMELAMTMYLKGDKHQGIGLAKEIAQKLPGDSNTQFNLGLMLADNGNYSESVTILEKVIDMDANFEAAKVRFYLGKSYLETENYWKALENLELAVQYDQGNAQAYYYLGRASEKLGNVSKAAQAYRNAIKLAGHYPEAEGALQGLSR